jgi:stage V sporulation protein SpoVS
MNSVKSSTEILAERILRMSEEVNGFDDPTVLKVRGDKSFNGDRDRTKEYVKGLAGAILTVLGKHSSARLKCVGNGALGNAYKAFCIARGDGSKRGMDIVDRGCFGSADFDGMEKTALIMVLTDVNKQG